MALRFDDIENIIDLRQLTLKIHSRRRLSLGIMVEFIVVLVAALVTLILVVRQSSGQDEVGFPASVVRDFCANNWLLPIVMVVPIILNKD